MLVSCGENVSGVEWRARTTSSQASFKQCLLKLKRSNPMGPCAISSSMFCQTSAYRSSIYRLAWLISIVTSPAVGRIGIPRGYGCMKMDTKPE